MRTKMSNSEFRSIFSLFFSVKTVRNFSGKIQGKIELNFTEEK